MRTKTVIELKSDNFDNELLTFDAYKEVRLGMSTGDFHTHDYAIIEVPGDQPVICGFCPITGQPWFDDEQIESDDDDDWTDEDQQVIDDIEEAVKELIKNHNKNNNDA